jgi:hypothetical protein
LGQTLDGMRVWDVRRAIRGLRSIDETRGLPLELRGRGVAAGIALYASLFEPYVDRLVLDGLPRTHREGPIFLNVLRHLDVPQAVAMAAERGPVRLRGAEPSAWAYPRRIAERLGWGETRIEIEPEPGEAE